MRETTTTGTLGRWARLVAALALLLPAAACGIGGEDTLLWRLDGRTVAGKGSFRPTTWALGPTFVITRAREVTAYDAATGRQRWTAPLPGVVCAGSPQTSGGLVAVQFGRAEHTCEQVAVIDLRNGAKVWERPLGQGERTDRGQLVLAGGAVVVDWLYGTAAFDLRDGRPLWNAASAGADCAFKGLAGGAALVAGRSCDADKGEVRGVHGLHPRTGRVLWTYDAPPGQVVAGPLASRPPVLALRADRRRSRPDRVAVLDASGAPRADIDLKAEISCFMDVDDPTRCEHVVVTEDTLYTRSGAGPEGKEAFAPIVAFDLATGRARWSTDNPDGNHLFPVGMDGGRLIASQPGTATHKGRGTPPRLVSVDPATGKTTIMWELTRKADFALRSGSYRQYAGGRFFLTETLVSNRKDTAVRAYGRDKREE